MPSKGEMHRKTVSIWTKSSVTMVDLLEGGLGGENGDGDGGMEIGGEWGWRWR
jgi:hypothetical protein